MKNFKLTKILRSLRPQRGISPSFLGLNLNLKFVFAFMSILSLLMASACKGDDTTPGGGPGGSSCQVEPLGSLEVDQELERNIGDLLTKFTSLARRVELLAFDQDGSKFNILDGISEIGLTGEAVGVVDGPAGVISPAGASAVSRATIFPAPTAYDGQLGYRTHERGWAGHGSRDARQRKKGSACPWYQSLPHPS